MNRRTTKARDARKAHAALVRRQLRRHREGLARMTRAADRAAEAIRRLGASTVGAALSARDLSRALNFRCWCDIHPSAFRVPPGQPLGILVDPIP